MLAACLNAVETTVLDTKKLNAAIDQLTKVRFVMTLLMHGPLTLYERACFFRVPGESNMIVFGFGRM